MSTHGLARLLSRLRTRQFAAVASQSFLLHDYMLTFPLEAEFVWGARWCAVKTVFLINRYGNLIGQTIFTLEEIGFLRDISEKICNVFPWGVAVYVLLAQESIHILILLRAWAIWGCRYRVAVALISAYVIYIAVSVALLVYSLAFASTDTSLLHLSGRTGVCIMQGGTHSSLQWILPSIALSLDCTVFVMIAFTLRGFFKRTQGFKRSPVLRVLAKDAALFFATNVVTGALTIVCQTKFEHDPRNILYVAFTPLLTVTGQRVVLNLRRIVPQRQELAVYRETSARPIQISILQTVTQYQEPEVDRASCGTATKRVYELSVIDEV